MHALTETSDLPMVERRSFFAYMRHVVDPPTDLIELLWNSPDELVKMGKPLIRKRCVRTTVLIRFDGHDYVVKRWLERSWRHALKQFVLPSRAARCWRDTKTPQCCWRNTFVFHSNISSSLSVTL